jgi:hypothetical protein
MRWRTEQYQYTDGACLGGVHCSIRANALVAYNISSVHIVHIVHILTARANCLWRWGLKSLRLTICIYFSVHGAKLSTDCILIVESAACIDI